MVWCSFLCWILVCSILSVSLPPFSIAALLTCFILIGISYGRINKQRETMEKLQVIINEEKQKSNEILNNILPETIAKRMKNGEHNITAIYRNVCYSCYRNSFPSRFAMFMMGIFLFKALSCMTCRCSFVLLLLVVYHCFRWHGRVHREMPDNESPWVELLLLLCCSSLLCSYFKFFFLCGASDMYWEILLLFPPSFLSLDVHQKSPGRNCLWIANDIFSFLSNCRIFFHFHFSSTWVCHLFCLCSDCC